MKTIGLTGGIGTGKSTISNYLKDKGFPIIDADKIARELVEPGMPTLKELSTVFGEAIIFPDGSLNRKALGEIVFSDKEKLKELNRIMYGKIIETTAQRIEFFEKEGKVKAAVIDAPLLFESGLDAYADEIWVADASEETRIARIMKRDNVTREVALQRIKSQMDNAEKTAKADYVLNNSGREEELYQQVDKLIGKYE